MDELIHREALKDAYVFLKSDILRHERHIREISQEMYRISRNAKLTPEERRELNCDAERFLR